jgi:hypothetical protein
MFSYAHVENYLVKNKYQSCGMDSHFEEAYDFFPFLDLENLSAVDDNMVLPFCSLTRLGVLLA